MRPFSEGLFSRRHVLGGFATASTAMLCPAAFSAAPMLNVQAPAWYRFKLGEFECTVISDGPLVITGAVSLLTGVPAEEVAQLLTSHFLPTDAMVLEQNTLLVNTGRQVLLFDTGMGSSKMFGPTTGRFLGNLAAAGIEPSQIDVVILTHAHSDHCWGVSEAGRPTFANAQVKISQADWDFWTTEPSAGAPDWQKEFVSATQKQLFPVRDRLEFVVDGKEVVPGVTALHAPGHTVGHTVYVISSGNQSLVFTGDLVHHHVLMLQRPRIEFSFDTDSKQAVQSRLRLLDMIAAQRLPILSYHFPFPGIGHVAKAGDGYTWHPTPMRTVL